MKYVVTLLIAGHVFSACQPPKKETAETKAEEPIAPVSLSLKWQTEPLLTTCESVIYDKENDILYVSNINGAPDGKDGNGFISKVTLDGKILEAQWIKGLDAPKGLGLFNGKLYAADIDKIYEIDIASGKIAKTYPVEGAQFLNDITVDGSGKVFVSDTGASNIILLENGKVSKWLSNVGSPNGLLAEGDRMLMVSFDEMTLNTIDPANKEITFKTDSIENADGIKAIGDGAYLVSSWNGMVHYIGNDWKRTLILDTRADSVSAADIEFIPERNLLLVPTFFKNSVMAYEVSRN
jgi:outer membrane protein assembly factor BamB